MGVIDEKWQQIQWIGQPVDTGAGSAEMATSDNRGRCRDYQHGSIYWTPQTGANEIHGQIRDLWASMGWENSFLGYPVTDEIGTGNSRSSRFQHGHISWNPTEGPKAHRSVLID